MEDEIKKILREWLSKKAEGYTWEDDEGVLEMDVDSLYNLFHIAHANLTAKLRGYELERMAKLRGYEVERMAVRSALQGVVPMNEDETLDAHTRRALSELEGQVGWNTDEDQLLEANEEAQIAKAFPTCSGRHDLYGEAMRFVSAKYSKFGLIGLVNWLLHRIEEAKGGK